jgi:hypothetical protein
MATKPVMEAEALPKVGVTVVSLIVGEPGLLTISSESGRIQVSPSLCIHSSAVLTKVNLSSVSCIVYSENAGGFFCSVVRVVGKLCLSPGGGSRDALCAPLGVVGVSMAVPGVGRRKSLCAVLGIIGISQFASLVAVSPVVSILHRIEGRGRRGGFGAAVRRREAASEEGKGERARGNDVGRSAMGERQHGGSSVEVQVRWMWG